MLDAQPTLTIKLPGSTGVGYKPQHFDQILNSPGPVEWLEIHAENYMGDGGRPIAQLMRLREDFQFSCHGVGLSIGGEGPLDANHLSRLANLVGWLEPAEYSEHLAWSTHDEKFLNDLLPLPYTKATLNRVCNHIDELQEKVGRRMLLENPSTYLEFAESEMDETEFLAEISKRTGCGLLLDVNNVYVSSSNRGWDAVSYIGSFPLGLVGEIHLGGHEQDTDDDGQLLLIDNHASEVVDPVWSLFEHTIRLAGCLPTLIEWDNDVPEWQILAAEAGRAAAILSVANQEAAA